MWTADNYIALPKEKGHAEIQDSYQASKPGAAMAWGDWVHRLKCISGQCREPKGRKPGTCPNRN